MELSQAKSLLMNHALKLLARRAHSEEELKRKLTRYFSRKSIQHVLVYLDETISLLREKNLLSDREFAESFTRDRMNLKPKSKRALKQELRSKGIEDDTIEKTLADYDELEACRKVAERKRNYSPQRLIAYLLRQGFPWDIIQEAIRT